MKLKTAICALLINTTAFAGFIQLGSELKAQEVDAALAEFHEIGRASCRERV